MPYVLIWSGWGLWTLAIAAFGWFLGPMLALGNAVSFILAAIMNFAFVKMLENMSIERKGRLVTRAQESTLFFMPLHYWTYILLVLGIGWFVAGPIAYLFR